MKEKKNSISRRSFVKGLSIAGGLMATSAWAKAAPLRYFKPTQIDNPLAAYPNRDWEKSYRNLFVPDSEYVFTCAPNDTHNCMLKGYVKNGVVQRIGPSYGYGKATDLYGNQASARWDPRICQKGLALMRRFYGDRRVKAPMIRRGFKEWADGGFQRDPKTGKPDPKFFQRGRDQWLRLSWDEAFTYAAKVYHNIAKTYSGKQGEQFLTEQGYDPSMVQAIDGAGTQTLKFRGGMAFVGATRIYGLYRFANVLALLDANVRKVGPDKAHGARGWDSYSWHTDLPPGHPMVTGQQTNDFELFSVERSKLFIAWGMNWITTKMPEAHWLTEARLKGTKVFSVTVEYSATASKSDEVAIIRPGTDPAFALGLAQYIIANNLYDKDFVENKSDLPFLVRMDTLEYLKMEDLVADFKEPELKSVKFLKKGEKVPANAEQRYQFMDEAGKDHFCSHVIYDTNKKQYVAISRDDYGDQAKALNLAIDLKHKAEVTLKDGKKVEVRTSFHLVQEYLNENMTPAQVAKITNCPEAGIISLAKQIAENKEKTIFACGMGSNQFFNNDLKDRAVFLVATLTRNVGFAGGNVGSFSGNYRSAIFGGEPIYLYEDPFNLQLKKGEKVPVKKYLHYESLHYFNYGDRPLRYGNKLFTGDGHTPAPTKAMWLSNSNSVLGNAKWHYDVVNNTLPRLEFVAFSDWWWTGSCEYADLVFAADSWGEFKAPDMCSSSTNPFAQVFPRSPLERIFETKGDLEIVAGVASALAKETGDQRFVDAFHFSHQNDVQEYLQRIIDGSATLRGYHIDKLEENAKKGIPALLNNRTYPRVSSYEQARSEVPWHTKSGRLEFYRPEKEFIESGENMVVYREPIDSTPYEPNVLVAKKHEAIRAKTPKDYGFEESDVSSEARQVRNVMRTPEELLKTQHPLRLKNYTHVYHTPKYRHGVHTTPIDTDYTSIWFGPFGDMYRHDKRTPSVTEGYVDINPLDAKELGVEDGDYIYIDADPEDRPYRNYKPGTEEAKVARLLLRARYYPGTPRGISRTWYNMSGSTFGSVKGQETRADGLARNPETNYQSMYRTGSHQSAVRAWLKPTLMTDTLIHKTMFGEGLEQGFAADIHCPTGAPREAFVKITRAEDGGFNGKGVWRPASLGYRPTYENQAMKEYLKGRFVKGKE